MRDATAELLRCPRCRADRSLTLTARESDERSISGKRIGPFTRKRVPPGLSTRLELLERAVEVGHVVVVEHLKRDHAEEVAEYEGNEHVHFFHQYYRAARRAGFEVERPWTPPGERPTTDTSGRDRAAGRSARCRAAATCARR